MKQCDGISDIARAICTLVRSLFKHFVLRENHNIYILLLWFPSSLGHTYLFHYIVNLLCLLLLFLILPLMDRRPESKTRKVDRERGPKMYRGVRMREWGTWVSEVRIPKTGERIWLGSFDNPEEAARAHDAAIYCVQGDNAVFNFPDHMRPCNLRPPPGLSFKKYIKEVAKVFAILNEVESPVNTQELGNTQDLPGLFAWFDEVDPPTNIQEPGNTLDLPRIPLIGETGSAQAARAYDAAMYCLQGESAVFDSSNHMGPVGFQPPKGSSFDNSVEEIARLFASFGEEDLPLNIEEPGNTRDFPCIPVIGEVGTALAGAAEASGAAMVMNQAIPETMFEDVFFDGY